jgi:hypothetical protein
MTTSSSTTSTASKIMDWLSQLPQRTRNCFLQTTADSKRLNILGHALLAACLSAAATLLWLKSHHDAEQRIRNDWLQCPPAKVESDQAKKFISDRTFASCNQSVFYYALLSSSATVSACFGLIGALASIYVGKEGLKEAKNFAINASITSIGIYSLASTFPLSFNAEESLKCSISEYQSLRALSIKQVTVTNGAQSVGQGTDSTNSELKAITACQPSFKLDSTIFSAITNAFTSRDTLLQQLDHQEGRNQKTSGTP